MQLLLGALVVLALLLWAAEFSSNPGLRSIGRRFAPLRGWMTLALAAFLAARGALYAAIPLAIVGLGLLGFIPWPALTFGSRAQISRMRTQFLELELDHASGAMRGRILAGRYRGHALDALDVPALMSMLDEVDSESRTLLMAYLDRRAPGWREHTQGDSAAGDGRAASTGKMTPEEAYQILGLQPGASADEIGLAHRSLMKKLHPDQGGSTYLAARVNEAKDVLLRRHR